MTARGPGGRFEAEAPEVGREERVWRGCRLRGLRFRGTRVARRQVAALLVAGLVLLLATTGALAGVTQPEGTAGCISETGAGQCADGHGLYLPSDVAVSPDGKNVYVASSDSDALVRLNRNRTTGAIGQRAGSAGCISESGAGPCANGHGLGGPNGVAVSPDGKSVYVASARSNAVVRLNRNTTTGAITQPAGAAGCISEDGSGPCADGHGLDGPLGVAVSPGGNSVYVASWSGYAVARLNRDRTTGAITQPAGSAGCIGEFGTGTCADGHGLSAPYDVALSPNGKSVYVASYSSYAVARLNRNTTTGAISQPAGTAGCVSEDGTGPCADGHGLINPADVAVSADGKSVYAASYISNAVVRLNRNLTTGAISQPAGTAGCVSETGAGPCANGHGLFAPFGVAVSRAGQSVYIASINSNAVVRMNRNTTTGAITQPAGTAGCISESGAGPCADGHGLVSPGRVAVSPSGNSVYIASAGSNAVARFNRTP